MSAPLIRNVALALAVAMLGVLSMMTGSAVAHEIQHAHHTAAMHGTGICAWMCAAGQVFEGAAVVLHTDLTPIGHAIPSVLPDPNSADPLLVSSRAPPTLR